MSCYFIARIQVHDEAEYNEYLKRVDEVFSRYNGKYLAVDTCPETLEGEPQAGRAVIIEFPDEASLKQWYFSAEYQEILKHRLKAAECRAMLVHGQE